MRMKKRKLPYYISVVFLLIYSFVMLYPIIWMFFTSFKTNADIRKNSISLWPKEWVLDGYTKAFTQATIGKWFINSMVVTISVTVVVILTSTLIGFVFAKFKFKMKRTLFVLLLATMMVPGQVTMIPRYLMIQKMGLFNTKWALIIPGVVSAFGIYLCRQFIEDIPDSICEAAMIDGETSFGIYRKIILPNLRPVIASLGIFTAMSVWNDYLNPLLMLNDKDKMTLPLALVVFSTEHTQDLTTTMAVASVIMVPMIIIFLLFQKQFVNSLVLSGIK